MKIILKHTNLNTLTTVCYMSDLFLQKATGQILWSMRAVFSVLPFESGQRADVKPHFYQTQPFLSPSLYGIKCGQGKFPHINLHYVYGFGYFIFKSVMYLKDFI